MNRFVIGDVVTVIPQGRGEKRHQPDCVYPKVLHIIQLLGETLKIADTVGVTVKESSDMDLVDNRVFIPTSFALQWQSVPPELWPAPSGVGVNRILIHDRLCGRNRP